MSKTTSLKDQLSSKINGLNINYVLDTATRLTIHHLPKEVADRIAEDLEPVIAQHSAEVERESRIDEAQNVYNLMQSYLADDMDSDDATYQLQVDLRDRLRQLNHPKSKGGGNAKV